MTRTGAILGSLIGGWLAFGMLLGTPVSACAQETGADSAGGTPADAASEGAGSGNSLIDTLNRALEKALSGRGDDDDSSTGGAGSPAAAPAPGDAVPSLGPVVVELFTSQGCSSCPPADEMFVRYAERPDVIALALHVGYWDYLGWEDPFAQPAFTLRQKAYARAARRRSIYTPQMIVEGREALIGADQNALDEMIAEEQAREPLVALHVSGGKGQYVIDLSAPKPVEQGAVVQIVRYAPQARVEILRGENAGLAVDYANVVTAWHAVAEWDGASPLRLNARIDGEQPAVVIVQAALPGKSGPLPGPILAAARLN